MRFPQQPGFLWRPHGQPPEYPPSGSPDGSSCTASAGRPKLPAAPMATKHISDLQVCQAVRDMKGGDLDAEDILHERTGQPPKVCNAALERAYDRGYIDCGIRVGRSWLTVKGEQLLLEAGPPGR